MPQPEASYTRDSQPRFQRLLGFHWAMADSNSIWCLHSPRTSIIWQSQQYDNYHLFLAVCEEVLTTSIREACLSTNVKSHFAIDAPPPKRRGFSKGSLRLENRFRKDQSIASLEERLYLVRWWDFGSLSMSSSGVDSIIDWTSDFSSLSLVSEEKKTHNIMEFLYIHIPGIGLGQNYVQLKLYLYFSP